jgi:FkbM family methyltransferase
MACSYFILTKPIDKPIHNNDNNQIIYLNKIHNYILPQSNIDYYMKNGLFESHLIEWSKQFCSKDKIMLDIGAHSGTYTIALSNYSKHVYSFEPQKMTYYALCGSVALSNLRNITCYNYGLGSQEQVGIKDLFIVSNDGGGSTVVGSSNKDSTHNNALAIEKIEIKTLDSFNISNIGFIKIDVEENELNVLYGSLETLKNSNYPTILFECNKDKAINWKELFEFLNNLGYKTVSVSGVSNMFLACRQ